VTDNMDLKCMKLTLGFHVQLSTFIKDYRHSSAVEVYFSEPS